MPPSDPSSARAPGVHPDADTAADSIAEAEARSARIRELEAALATSERARITAQEASGELRVDLHRAQADARREAHQAAQLLRGLQVISEAQEVETLFAGMLAVLREVLGFTEAFILVFSSDAPPEVVATTSPSLRDLQWRPGRFTARVLKGTTIALFDLQGKEEWQAVDAGLRARFTAALHVPLKSPRSQAMLVCLHPERGFFDQERCALARRFAGLASQALHNAEHATALAAKVAERTQALRDQRDFAMHLTMNMAQGLVTTDREGLITLTNPAFAALCGRTEAALRGRPLTELLETDAPLLAGSRELLLRRPGEAPLLTLVATAPRRRAAAEDGAIHVFTDLSERQRIQETLVRARDAAEEGSRAKSTFLANMSHELRTPLNAILGYCELLVDEAEDREDTELLRDLERIHLASRHLLGLIGNILDLSKIEAGKMEVFLEAVAVPGLFDDVLATIEPLAAENHNVVLVDVVSDLPPLYADPVKTRQVLINLIGNACKFTERGTIELIATQVRAPSAPRPMIRLQVRDTGIGMLPEQAAQIFEAFTQVDGSPTRRFGGTGLGLTITRHFVEMMDGTIEVTSTPGRGTIITVELPIYPPPDVLPMSA